MAEIIPATMPPVRAGEFLVWEMGGRLAIMREGDLWTNVCMDRDEARQLAKMLERFAKTGRVDDDAEREDVAK